MSNDSDDMDLEALISNPFQFLGAEEDDRPPAQVSQTRRQEPVQPVRTLSPSADGKQETPPTGQSSAGMDIDRINKNHPLELRVLSVEKNQLNWDMKVETLKEIVEHQNERIDLLEKELDLLRKKSDA